MSNTNLSVKAGTVARTICLFLALVNQLLSASGRPILPIEDAEIEALVTTTATIMMAVWNWWKNNSFTKPALAADEYLNTLRSEE